MMAEVIPSQTGAMASEPARIVGLVTAVVTAVLALLAYFGLGSPELTAIVLGGIATVGPIVAGFVIRGRVFSPSTVREMVKTGIEVGRQVQSGTGATLYRP